MSIKSVLFDLDVTLLPMDMEVFLKKYFGLLTEKLSHHGYEPKELFEAVWTGTAAMVKNDGSRPNEEVFWESFAKHYGDSYKKDLPLFDEFYKNDFVSVRAACGFAPQAAEAVAKIKQMGLRVALATNPVFPSSATEHRIHWAGLVPEDFELFTTYENSNYCKPNPRYYESVAERLKVDPKECLMVGNDVSEDMVAEKIGMKVFLLTDCLINKNNEDISVYPSGGFAELLKYIDEIYAK